MDIRIERKKRLMTQYDLKKKTGIDQSIISLVESGHRKLKETEEVMIANVFLEYDEKK